MRRLVVVALSFAMLLVMAAPLSASGVSQISGSGALAWLGEVPEPPGPEEDPPLCPLDLWPGEDDIDQYAIALTSGDLNGCIYGLVTDARAHASGTYQEIADEIFVGTWDGMTGTFGLTEFFTAKFDTETEAQIFGRCQHPLVENSGTGDFTGISGRLDFKDDVEAGTVDYRGHLRIKG